jgi:formylmethanofuran dehydrogenase subunit D
MHFVFVSGRTTRQGQHISIGKDTPEYMAMVSTLQMNPQDIDQLGLSPGMQVVAHTEWGQAIFQCAAADLPPGVVFAPYGPPTSQIMGGITEGTGMPTTKGLEIEIEPLAGQPLDSRLGI